MLQCGIGYVRLGNLHLTLAILVSVRRTQGRA
ncbi:hypothetical protein FHR19_000356 [Sphingomonas yantingensis]|uniref:Uncharacterized protein n=1 Tax=Sphingomonas yantingensis TaxID=1241761 RepID=A0A7W9AML9_9SPHN|nr:hypothetical protein [Sphingomonas yantingensis]